VTDPGGDAAWIDARRLTRVDAAVAAAAGLFLAWTLVPVWYAFVPGGIPVEGFEFRVNGWHGLTVVAGVLAALALVLVVLRMAGREVRIGGESGRFDLAVAVAAEVVTVLGLAVQPEFFDVAWGLYAAMGLGLLWVLAAATKAVGRRPAGSQ
jgi:hypothetical protein